MSKHVTELVDFRDSWIGNMAFMATGGRHPWYRHTCQHFRALWVDFWSRSA
jgi:hypothetical protein